jgi:hypothetical protein
MAFSLIAVLVKKLATERYDIQIYILQTLYNCIRLGKEPLNPTDAIKSNALSEFNNLLKSSITDVKVWASKCIMVLWYIYKLISVFLLMPKRLLVMVIPFKIL